MFAEEEKTATGKKYPPEKEKVPSEKRAEKKEISRFEFSPEIFFLYQYFLAARGNKEEYNCQLLCSIRTYSGPVSELWAGSTQIGWENRFTSLTIEEKAMDACLCTLERAHGKIFDFTVKGISQKNIFAPVFPGEFRTWKEAFVYREFILLESVSWLPLPA